MTSALQDNPTIRRCIQKVATGPEYSKNLSFEEAYEGGKSMLLPNADPVQVGVFLIALRMKRETDEENAGILQAILDSMHHVTAPVDNLLDIGEPYNGYTRCLPMSAFLPAVLAACDMPTVIHGVETVGPKYGATAHKVLRVAGKNADLEEKAATAQLSTAGWTYVDQSRFCPRLHALLDLRNKIVKRSVLNTVEVLTAPIRARGQTHLLTGYVHKLYPPVYAKLAQQAGFSSTAIVRGSEGGVIGSLRSPTEMFAYYDQSETYSCTIDPASANINQSVKNVPLPKSLAQIEASDAVAARVDVDALAASAAQAGLDALRGKQGVARDSLVFAGAVALTHLKRAESLKEAAEQVRQVLDSGAAMERFAAAA